MNGIWSEPNLSILISFFIIKTQTLWKIISTAQLRRRHPCSLLELSAEAGRVHIAHSQADVIDRHVRVEQQLLRLPQAQRPYIIRKILSHLLFEQIAHISDAHMEIVCQVRNGEIRRGIMCRYQLLYLGGAYELILSF